MSQKEKMEILERVKNLPENDKQFVLGYAAGITAKSQQDAEEVDEHDDEGNQGVR